MRYNIFVDKGDVEILRWLSQWFLRSGIQRLMFLGRRMQMACDELVPELKHTVPESNVEEGK